MQKNISQSGICARMNHTWEHLNFYRGHESATGTELNITFHHLQNYIQQKAAAKNGNTSFAEFSRDRRLVLLLTFIKQIVSN